MHQCSPTFFSLQVKYHARGTKTFGRHKVGVNGLCELVWTSILRAQTGECSRSCQISCVMCLLLQPIHIHGVLELMEGALFGCTLLALMHPQAPHLSTTTSYVQSSLTNAAVFFTIQPSFIPTNAAQHGSSASSKSVCVRVCDV